MACVDLFVLREDVHRFGCDSVRKTVHGEWGYPKVEGYMGNVLMTKAVDEKAVVDDFTTQ